MLLLLLLLRLWWCWLHTLASVGKRCRRLMASGRTRHRQSGYGHTVVLHRCVCVHGLHRAALHMRQPASRASNLLEASTSWLYMLLLLLLLEACMAGHSLRRGCIVCHLVHMLCMLLLHGFSICRHLAHAVHARRQRHHCMLALHTGLLGLNVRRGASSAADPAVGCCCSCFSAVRSSCLPALDSPDAGRSSSSRSKSN